MVADSNGTIVERLHDARQTLKQARLAVVQAQQAQIMAEYNLAEIEDEKRIALTNLQRRYI